MAQIRIVATLEDRLPVKAQIGLRVVELWAGESMTVNIRAGQSVFIIDDVAEKGTPMQTVWGQECQG